MICPRLEVTPAAALLVVGGVRGYALFETVGAEVIDPTPPVVLAALVHGAVQWFAAAGITSSLGRVTDEYLTGTFEWRYLNAPFYVLAIGGVLHGLSAFFLGVQDLEYLAVALTGGTLLGLASTLAFAIAESRLDGTERHNQGPGGPSSE